MPIPNSITRTLDLPYPQENVCSPGIAATPEGREQIVRQRVVIAEETAGMTSKRDHTRAR